MILQLSGQVIECLQESSLQDYEMTERKTWAVDARRTFHSNSPSVSAAWKAWGVWFSWSLFHDWLGSEEDRGSKTFLSLMWGNWGVQEVTFQRNKVYVWGNGVFECNPSFWNVLWFKGCGNSRHDYFCCIHKKILQILEGKE